MNGHKGEDKGDENVVQEIQFEDEMMQITRREEPKPEPKPEQPKVAEVLDIVDDDVEIDDDFDFDMEATDNTEYDFTSMMGDDDEEIQEEEVFYIVEDMPTFNGGDPATEFRKYIAQNLRYPEIAAENGVSGRVIVQFAVNKTGRWLMQWLYVVLTLPLIRKPSGWLCPHPNGPPESSVERRLRYSLPSPLTSCFSKIL